MSLTPSLPLLPGIFLYILQEPGISHLLLPGHLLPLLPNNRFHNEIREQTVLASNWKLFRAPTSLCLHNDAPLQRKPSNRYLFPQHKPNHPCCTTSTPRHTVSSKERAPTLYVTSTQQAAEERWCKFTSFPHMLKYLWLSFFFVLSKDFF